MIISHKHRFIFLKTTKTAGTSIEIALSRFCGPDDVITPIGNPDEERIRTDNGSRGAQNYALPVADYRMADFLQVLKNRERCKKYYNHIPAVLARERVGHEIWDSYFKFCVVRNPWDRFISLYYFRYKSEPRPSLLEFANSKWLQVLHDGSIGVYAIDDQVAVDRFVRHENLAEDLDAVRTRIGIPEELSLPRVKAGFRKDRRSYREILGDTERSIIDAKFRDEIELLDYNF